MTPAVGWYFRKRYFLGADSIPNQGPIVIIASHSASFLDAIIMGVMLRRPIHYYVRGDIFRKPLVRWIFSQLHMIPVYSADLAKQDLLRNSESFDVGSDILCKGGVLLIFPEGLSRQERNLMPFRKSPVRVILQALQKDESLNISVVPIGINFTKHAFRADLQMVTGKVISVNIQSIAQLFPEPVENFLDTARAMSLLTAEMRKIFEPMVLYVEKEERIPLLDRELLRLEAEDRGMSYEKFDRQRALCQYIDGLTEEAYLALKNESIQFVRKKRNGLLMIGLILSFPIFLIGLILNFLPYHFGKYMADTKVTRQDFYTSVQLAVSAVSYVLWLLILFSIWMISGSHVMLYALLSAPITGWFAVKWWDDII